MITFISILIHATNIGEKRKRKKNAIIYARFLWGEKMPLFLANYILPQRKVV
jgi:hypothetical protein